MNNLENIEIENYAVFLGVDETIFKLNPSISELDFEFIYLDVSELEKSFKQLFNYPEVLASNSKVKFASGAIVSREFYNSFNAQPFVELGADGLFLLKKKTNYFQEIKNGAIQINPAARTETQDFAFKLERTLRLFKNGDVVVPTLFEIAVESRFIYSKAEMRFNPNYTRSIYDIKDHEAQELSNFLSQENQSTLLTELAEKYFFDSYMLNNPNEKIVNLMTALESIFNRNPNQISHVIARHLSLIISIDKEDFLENYKRIKKLYGYRSKIVHGQSLNLDGDQLNSAVSEIQDITRKAILYCLNSNMDKDELFTYLNCKGF